MNATQICNATLNCVCSFIRLLRFDGRLLKILIPAEYMNFLKTWKACSWCMKMVLIPGVNTVHCWVYVKMFSVIYNKVQCSFKAIILQLKRLNSLHHLDTYSDWLHCDTSTFPFRIRVTLQLTVGQSVSQSNRLGVEHRLGLMTKC
jgi:hypothetical protein